MWLYGCAVKKNLLKSVFLDFLTVDVFPHKDLTLTRAGKMEQNIFYNFNSLPLIRIIRSLDVTELESMSSTGQLKGLQKQ